MHKLLYREGLTLEKSREAIVLLKGTVEGGDEDIDTLLSFLAASTRGIAR
jgi:UDP-N-acetylglucosamine acyltransferase